MRSSLCRMSLEMTLPTQRDEISSASEPSSLRGVTCGCHTGLQAHHIASLVQPGCTNRTDCPYARTVLRLDLLIECSILSSNALISDPAIGAQNRFMILSNSPILGALAGWPLKNGPGFLRSE